MHNANILVVDDIYTNLELMESILDDEGYEVRTAISGEAALKSIEIQAPDLILLDIMMPGMDGYETCAKIKEDERFKTIPIIFLSAKNEAKDKVIGFDLGAVDYLTKPFEIDEILVRIKTHLTLHFLQQELENKLAIIDKYVITSSSDLDGTITQVSEAFCKISGYTKKELLNKKEMHYVDIPPSLSKELLNTIKRGETWKGEIKNKTKNGEPYWVEVIMSPDFDSNHNVIGYTSIRHDITYQKKIEHLSITDQLTNLYNRRHFNDTFELEIKRAIRNGALLSIIMLDIDFFKQYNDTYGHQAGDRVLESIGTVLHAQLKRPDDFAFRLGGEEFGVICNTKNAKQAEHIAEKIRLAIEGLQIEHKGSSICSNVTASLGMICVDFSQKENYSLSDDKLYKLADDELYRAKGEGRNRVCIKTI